MKDFLFVCNFKMNSVPKELYERALGQNQFENLILCPSACELKDYASLKNSNKVKLGAQDASRFAGGAHTGEISADMLKNCGVEFCIVGHSERKRFDFETLDITNQKILQLQNVGIVPIVCVGEDILKGEEFATRFVLAELAEVLKNANLSNLIVAYEPIWAIGSGKIPSASHINAVAEAIKKYCGIKTVLYGGSFGEQNFEEIAGIKSIDGALIGGASLKPQAVCKMILSLQGKSKF